MPLQSPITSPCPPASRTGARTRLLLAVSVICLALPATQALAAQPPVGLGTADDFAVLAGSAVTNTGPTTVNGDLGVSPGTAMTGWPPGIANGSFYVADGVANQAKSDLTIAYDDAAGRTRPWRSRRTSEASR